MTSGTNKMLVQCDFDGTITEWDVSFRLLDAFAGGDWRQMLEEYRAGQIPVGAFNTKAFALIKADRQTLLDFIARKDEVRIRPGFGELLDYCRQNRLKFVIVSNGVDFYIEAILKRIGIDGIEVFAARSRFAPGGLEVQYIGPDGKPMEDSFKEAYTQLFIDRGYRVVYVGNGISDIYPARKAHYVFATADLLERCQETDLHCIPFHDLNDVLAGLKGLPVA